MNSTERFKQVLNVNPRDHLKDDNRYWRVYRDIQCGPSCQPRYRQTRHPGHCSGLWPWVSVATGRPMHPLKAAKRVFVLTKMLGGAVPFSSRPIILARKAAYGDWGVLARLRALARQPAPPTQRQLAIARLSSDGVSVQRSG